MPLTAPDYPTALRCAETALSLKPAITDMVAPSLPDVLSDVLSDNLPPIYEAIRACQLSAVAAGANYPDSPEGVLNWLNDASNLQGARAAVDTYMVQLVPAQVGHDEVPVDGGPVLLLDGPL
ncbi:MAG: hypothetical protein JWM27_77 [Gemmatimonadetes bacterium]|nr:hypothetical protein [Gemmatimonadota bacterium]